MRGNGNGAQSAAGTACQATAKQLQKQAKMWREKVKLTDKRFQNCGKTLFFSKNHADFGYCFEPKKHNFRWQAQGIVTFNVENTVLLTPPHGNLWVPFSTTPVLVGGLEKNYLFNDYIIYNCLLYYLINGCGYVLEKALLQVDELWPFIAPLVICFSMVKRSNKTYVDPTWWFIPLSK